MGVACPAGQERLRRELRGYFGELMTPAVRSALSGGDGDDGDGEAYRSVVRQLGRDGWLALGWPVEYGGGGCLLWALALFSPAAGGGGGPGLFMSVQCRWAARYVGWVPADAGVVPSVGCS